VYVANSIIADNGDGIFAEAAGLQVVLARVELLGNLGRGIFAQGINLPSNTKMLITVNDSTIAGSGSYGIWAAGSFLATRAFVSVVVTRSSIVSGAATAIVVDRTGAAVLLNGSTIAHNAGGGWSVSNGGAVQSWGNNSFADGSNDSTMQLLTLQ
jgi:hypothetical protein